MARKALKERLESAEIYFKTVAAIFLSGMAIFLSYQANRIASIQADVATRALKITETEMLPHIVGRLHWVKSDPQNQYSDDYVLLLINDGGPLIWCDPGPSRVFMWVSWTPKQGVTENIYIPVDYYCGFHSLREPAGSLSTRWQPWLGPLGLSLYPGALWFAVPCSNVSWWELREQLGKLGLYIGLRVFQDITYMDRLGEVTEETLVVSPITGRLDPVTIPSEKFFEYVSRWGERLVSETWLEESLGIPEIPLSVENVLKVWELYTGENLENLMIWELDMEKSAE